MREPYVKATATGLILCATVLFATCGRVRHEPPQQPVPRTSSVPTALSPEQKSWIARAEKHEKDGWIYLHIEGTPRERGFQYGYLLADNIKESLRVTREVWLRESGMEWPWIVGESKKIFRGKVDAELLAEIDGIVEGLGAAGIPTTRDEMVAYNAYIELSGYWWPEQKKSMDVHSPDARKQSCSSFIATGSMTADGGIVLGHNTMTSYAEADCNIILDLVPEKGYRILMQASPGWIHSGTDFFITSAGIVGSETTIGDFSGFDDGGTPEFVRMRRATQDASTIDQWCDIMKKGNNGGYANAWLVGDVKTNEIARLEIGLKYTGLEKTKDGYFVGSNIAENVKILRLETDEHETDIRRSGVARRVRWKQLMRRDAGKITLEMGELYEADHYDSYLGRNSLSWRALCAHGDYDTLDLYLPFEPGGTVDAKVVDSRMAKSMSFAARWGAGCGRPFNAQEFLKLHPQFEWMEGILKSRASYPWTKFQAGER